MAVSILNTDSDLSGNTVAVCETAKTVTGLWTFDRDPSAPFAVSSGSAVVSNLDADKLDGNEASAFAQVDGSAPFDNTGLQVDDTGGDHQLTIAPGEDFSADRTLSIDMGDAARTLTFSGNPTLGDWFDQSLKQADNVAFNEVHANDAGLKWKDTGGDHNYVLKAGEDLSATRNLTITLNDANRAITLNGSPTLNDWFDQEVKTTSTPTFGSVILTGDAGASPNVDTVFEDSIVKAWARVANTGTPAITDDFNVTSLTDNATGDTTVTFATALATANYAAIGTVENSTTSVQQTVQVHTQAAGSVRVVTLSHAGVGGAISLVDIGFNIVVVGE